MKGLEERYWWMGLNCVPGVGSITCRRLIDAFGSPRMVFRASRRELMEVDGVGEELARRISAFEAEGAIEREVAACEKAAVTVCTLGCDSYPEQLLNLYDPPPVLYLRGTLLASDRVSVALVGTRRPTAYGRSVAEKLARGLAELGFTVVSGLARGIDGLAHSSALAVSGRTVAVLGHGIDRVFPAEHRELAGRVADSGALITEFPIGTPPARHNFPRRNRIISGLAMGTVVVEASGGSGSLITARCAMEQGREVFAVPGPVTTDTSRGAHRLIKEGATLIEGVDDILEALPLHLRALLREGVERGETPGEAEAPGAPSAPRVSAEERTLLGLISSEPRHIDRIIEESGLAPSAVSGLLVQLELKGLVARRPGSIYETGLSAGGIR